MALAASNVVFPLAPQVGAALTNLISNALGSTVAFTFNAAGDKTAFIFQAPSTDVPDIVSFVVDAVSVAGSAGDIEATWETLDADDLPSGTPVTNSATGTGTISTTGAKTISGMEGTATCTKGAWYAIVLTAGAGWNRTLTIKSRTGASQSGGTGPYVLTKDSAGSWARLAGGNNCGYSFGVAKADGTYFHIPGLAGAYSSCALQSYASTTNPDERGNRFTVPGPCRLWGAIIANFTDTPTTNDDHTVLLYTDHLGTPATSTSEVFSGTTKDNNGSSVRMFTTPVDLVAGTVYALMLRAGGSGTMVVPLWTFLSNEHLAGFAGTNIYSTTRNDATGACTDSDLAVHGIFPLISAIDDGAGGGGGGGIRLAGHGGLAA